MENGSSAATQHDLDMTRLFMLSLSFFGGVLLTVLLLGIFADEPDYGNVGRQLQIPAEVEQLARSVGEPDQLIEVEVAGIQCEAQSRRVVGQTTPGDLLSLWNETVQSPGDECNPAFGTSLGRDWLLTHTMLTVFNEGGSLYEVETSNDLVTGVAIYLVPDDAAHSSDLQQLLTTLWGEENVDWERECADTDRPWIGVAVPEGVFFELTSCEVFERA